MEIVISSLIGAFSAIIVAMISNKRRETKKDNVIKNIVKELNMNNSNNVYLINYKKPNEGYKFESKSSNRSEPRTLIIIK